MDLADYGRRTKVDEVSAAFGMRLFQRFQASDNEGQLAHIIIGNNANCS